MYDRQGIAGTLYCRDRGMERGRVVSMELTQGRPRAAPSSTLTHSGDCMQNTVKTVRRGRCFRAVDMLPSHSGRDTPIEVRGAMITQVLHCPYCQGTDIVRHGKSPEGKQRYRCRQCLEGRGRTFLLDYAYAGQSPAIKQQIVDMAMNAVRYSRYRTGVACQPHDNH